MQRSESAHRSRHQARRHHHRAGGNLHQAPAALGRVRRRGRLGPRRRRHLELADHPAAAGLAQPRQGRQGLRRRRQRVRGPARRLRRRPGRPRASGHRQGGQGPGGERHPLRAAHAQRHRRRRGTVPALGTAAVALRQLRHRGDDGRRPPDALLHRPRPDHQGRGRLSRPPRLGPGLGHARRTGRGPEGTPEQRPVLQRHPAGHHQPHADRPVQRPRTASPGSSRSTPARSPG